MIRMTGLNSLLTAIYNAAQFEQPLVTFSPQKSD